MAVERAVINGTVRNGVIVPEGSIGLPEGISVEILLPEVSPDLQAELDAWEAASDQDMAVLEQQMNDSDAD